MTIRVRLDDGSEISVDTDDPMAAAAAGRKYQERMKGGLGRDITGGAAKIRQGASLNTSDELAGFGAGAKDALRGMRPDSGGSNLDFMIDTGRQPTMTERVQNVMKDFQGGYQRGRQGELEQQQQFDARRPKAGLALEIGSSFAPFGFAKGAAQIGGMAAFNGFASGEDLGDRATRAGIGGVTGYGVAKGMEKAAPFVSNLLQSGADKLARKVGQYQTRQAEAAMTGNVMKEAADRGIPMTRGQVTGNEEQIAFEQAARRGARGQGAQKVLAPVFDQQETAIRDAIQRVPGEGGPVIERANQAGGIVQGALRDAEKVARQGVDQAYGAVRDMGGQVPRRTGIDLLSTVNNSLAQRNIDVTFRSARALTPETFHAYDAVKELAERMQGPTGKTAEGFPYTDFSPVSLSLVEQTRKLVNTAADNATRAAKLTGRREDQAAALAIRDSFDDWLDNAIDEKMLTNDSGVLDALKWARTMHKTYAEKFRSNSAINTILGKAEDERQALNALYGVAGIGNPKGAAQAIEIIAQETPEAFQALRKAGVMRMTERLQGSIETGGKTDFRQLYKTLGDALDGSGKEVTAKLYSPAEIAELRVVRDIVRKAIPPQGTVNTSASGYEASRAVQAVFGALRGFAGRFGLDLAEDAWNAGLARAALRPPSPPMAPLPGSAGRIAAMYGAGNVARKSPGLVGPFTNLMYEDPR